MELFVLIAYVEIPGRMRHFDKVKVRFASWDLSRAFIVDPKHNTQLLANIYPQNKAQNSNRGAAPLKRPNNRMKLDTQVAEEIRRSAKPCKQRGKKRKTVIKCVNYLLKNARYLRYHECLKKGFPIASGVIEGACRHLIKDRLDITGARWTIKKAEAILKLRSLRSSGDFEEYWSFHEKQELQRNHSSNYANALIPSTCSVKTSLCLVKL